MGEVAETMTKKKKKGRPSLLELQKRALKQQQLQKQQQQPRKRDEQPEEHRSALKNPNSGLRSTRRNSNPRGISVDSAWINGDEDVDDDEEDDDDERREKKLRLLHGLNSHAHRHSPNSQLVGSDLHFDESNEIPQVSVKQRKIGRGIRGSDDTGEKDSKATDVPQGSPMESGPTTPLPDKKLLVFILDRLQKKDTYGVFSDPVDPEELPDYHEIITNPMDFTTLRKKLDSGVYSNLEQFERDVFLICTNAMEYNASDTIYFRQARAMHEMAKKDFENLRQDSDDEEPQPQPTKVVKRGRPPGKSLKKQSELSSIDRTTSDISAEAAALTTVGDSSKVSGSYNLRKASNSYRFRPADTPVRFGHHGNNETQSGWSVDWENEFPPSVVKAVNKYGMKHFNVDDNRRDTYNQLSTSMQEPSVLTTLEDEPKQLIPVGLNTEYGYARSLARYAANLSPVVWKIASRRIKNVLPSGIEFGRGWVGENHTVEDPQRQILMTGKQKCSNEMVSDDHSRRILSPTSSVSRHSLQDAGEESALARVANLETEFAAANSLNPSSASPLGMNPSSASPLVMNPAANSMNPSSASPLVMNPAANSMNPSSASPLVMNPAANSMNPSSASPLVMNPSSASPLVMNPERNGFIHGFSGLNHNQNQMMGIGRHTTPPNLTNEDTLGVASFPYNKQEFQRFPPDLNTRLVSPTSPPGSNAQAGSSQHPDLALQL